MRVRILVLLFMIVGGCAQRQPWTFRNGVGVAEGRPPSIIAEVFTGGECGFACEPPATASRVYCDELGRAQGDAPDGLEEGERYCFMGTALDERGDAYAIGCASAEVGGEPIDITLSPIDEDRVIRRACQVGPVVELDAGTARLDAGAPADAAGVDASQEPDAGAQGIDAGASGVDAGGLPIGTPVSVTFEVFGAGSAALYDARGRQIGSPLREGTTRTLEAYVGFFVRIDMTPDSGGRLDSLTVPTCGLGPRCEFTLWANHAVQIRFVP